METEVREPREIDKAEPSARAETAAAAARQFSEEAEETGGAEESDEKEIDAASERCPSCGANLVFDPGRRELVCPHCGGGRTIETEGEVVEIPVAHAFAAEGGEDTDISFRCESCGARIVLKERETAIRCPFCGTAHAVEEEDQPGVRPGSVLPFSVDRAAASAALAGWRKKRRFAPTAFRKSIRPDRLAGVYAPCFTFDSTATSAYEGRFGERRTRTVGSGKNRRVEHYTVWYPVSGTRADGFNDVAVCAGDKFSEEQYLRIAPFPLGELVPYSPEYLYGFAAYRYDEGPTKCWNAAKRIMDGTIRRRIVASYHPDVVDYLNVRTEHTDVTYKYTLLPVYVGSYDFHGKTYNVFVNGRTGKTWGKAPRAGWKIALPILLGIALAVGLFFLIRALI